MNNLSSSDYHGLEKRKRDFHINKILKNPKQSWNQFYDRNKEKFYKNRHWTLKELPISLLDKSIEFIEFGCGVGNTIIPILKEKDDWSCYGCDFSQNALDLLSNQLKDLSTRCVSFLCDISSQLISNIIPNKSFDLCFLIFVLSSISPDNFEFVIKNICSILNSGGYVFLRDYGIDDAAMHRFKKESMITSNFYFRKESK
uniref:Methyltransferase-like protein 6 (Trinotate prediction) n=1 Tax=Myxobolus squamalis TaxID=59785 RepID=A0A6B2G1T7_MYXSQ